MKNPRKRPEGAKSYKAMMKKAQSFAQRCREETHYRVCYDGHMRRIEFSKSHVEDALTAMRTRGHLLLQPQWYLLYVAETYGSQRNRNYVFTNYWLAWAYFRTLAKGEIQQVHTGARL